jgi:hypothetical protein
MRSEAATGSGGVALGAWMIAVVLGCGGVPAWAQPGPEQRIARPLPRPPQAGPPDIGAACEDSGDCAGTLVCHNARCASEPCSGDDDCAAGRMCRRGACRIRECVANQDCNISRRCVEGLCALPAPMGMRAQRVPEAIDLDGSISVGPAFPAGLLAEIEVGLGQGRSLYAGAGTSLDGGGLGWRAGMRLFRGFIASFERDVWVGVLALRGAKNVAGTALGVGLGSGRALFDRNSAPSALWWAGGAGFTLPHGERQRRTLRIELGAAFLVDGAYPPKRDVALIPTFALRYGLRF